MPSKITLVEPHRIKSVWKRGSQTQIIGTVRQRTPLHSQPIIGAFLRNTFADDLDVEILDSRLEGPQTEELYKVVPYGDGTLEHYRVGLSLDSKRFRDAICESSILGITVNFTQEADISVDIALRAKRLNPEIRVV